MGYFGTFIFRDGQWQQRSGAGPELVVDVHDSDIATIDYRPAPPGLGRFYLGHQPRDFFADPDASQPVDVPAEVEAFVGWAEQTLGRAPRPAQLRPLVAEGGDPAAIVEREGLAQISDSGELEEIVAAAIDANPDAAEQIRAGNGKAIGAIVGAVMKETKGRADGGEVNRLIREKLGT